MPGGKGQPPKQLPGETVDDWRRRWAAWWEEKTGRPIPEVEHGARPPGQGPPGFSAAATHAAGQPVMPNSDDYWVKEATDALGVPTGGPPVRAEPNEPGAWIDPSYNEDLDYYNRFGQEPADTYHPPAWRPGGLGLAQEAQKQDAEAQEATNMVNYLDAIARGIEADIAAGHLGLAQAAEEFDRRLDAFAEAGAQMAALWQWTVPKGSAGQPLHAGIRESLGMQPWISDPVEYDPVAQAQEIIESMPPMSPIPSTDPHQEAVEAAEELLG